MRQVIALFGVIAVVVTGSAALQAQPSPPPGASGTLRSLRVESADPEHAGLFEPGDRVRREVVFSNALNTTVTLEVLQKTCGCLEAGFESAAVAPGGIVRLVLASAAVPQPGEQAHAVTFRATWTQDGAARSETGRVFLRYESDIEFIIRPEGLSTVGYDGATASAELWLRFANEDAAEAPVVVDPECTLPGWKLTSLRDPALPEGVVRLVASGPAAGIGVHSGMVRWRSTPEGAWTKEIPIRVRVIAPWKAVPSGVVHNTAHDDGPARWTIRIEDRASSGRSAASVRFDPPAPGYAARLSHDNGATAVVIEVTGEPPEAGVGASVAEVLDAEGAVLVRIPVIRHAGSAAWSASSKP